MISDSEGIDRITAPPRANYTFCVEAGINAGIDMVVTPMYEHNLELDFQFSLMCYSITDHGA